MAHPACLPPPAQLIADADAWEVALPQLIEAFFSVGGEGEEQAYAVHQMYAAAFPTRSVPLLRYDRSNAVRPFRQLA